MGERTHGLQSIHAGQHSSALIDKTQAKPSRTRKALFGVKEAGPNRFLTEGSINRHDQKDKSVVEGDRNGRGVTTAGRRGEFFQGTQLIPMLVFVVIIHIYS